MFDPLIFAEMGPGVTYTINKGPLFEERLTTTDVLLDSSPFKNSIAWT